MKPGELPCVGRNPCVVRGCVCKVPRWGKRFTRVRCCTCCAHRLSVDEHTLFATETKKSPVVAAILSLLAGELALEKEDAAEAQRVTAAAQDPFLDELDPETRERARKLMMGQA